MSPRDPADRHRRLSLVSAGFLTGGLAALVAFHFLPSPHGRGWVLWQETCQCIRTGRILERLDAAVGISSFVALVLIVAVAPFLHAAIARSRIVRVAILGVTGWGCLVMGFFFLREPILPWGGLIAASILSFIGALLVPARELVPAPE